MLDMSSQYMLPRREPVVTIDIAPDASAVVSIPSSETGRWAGPEATPTSHVKTGKACCVTAHNSTLEDGLFSRASR